MEIAQFKTMPQINVTERQRERFDQIKREVHEAENRAVPIDTDEQLMKSLMDTWDAVGEGHYSNEGMPDPLTPTAAHEQLDDMGVLDASHGPGCYALRLADPPDDPRAVFEAWTAHHDAAPQWIVDGLADAGKLAYVGASGTVYDRLMDHCEGDVRQTAVMRCYPPVEVLGIEPKDDPFEAEFNYTRAWVEKGFTVWNDGVLHGL